MRNFNLELSNPVLWNGLSCAADTNLMFAMFHDAYLKCFEYHFPLMTAKLKHKNSPRHSWMTKSLIKCSHKKNKLYKVSLKTGNPNDKTKYSAYLAIFKKSIRLAEKNYYDEQLRKVSGNLKKTWSILNNLISKKGRSDQLEFT